MGFITNQIIEPIEIEPTQEKKIINAMKTDLEKGIMKMLKKYQEIGLPHVRKAFNQVHKEIEEKIIDEQLKNAK